MQFNLNQKILKMYSYELLHDLEIALADCLEVGTSDNWTHWLKEISQSVVQKATAKAIKNKRTSDFSKFQDFIVNIDFADPIEIIANLSGKDNVYFKKYFPSTKEKNLLIQSVGEANRFRNLIDHPVGKTVYITDINDFVKTAIIITNILHISSLNVKFKKIVNDIENSILESSHYIKENIESIYHNLPVPDYEEWSGLVGRNETRNEIMVDFQKGYNRIIAITGGGGIGKTALAINIAYEYLKPTNYQFRHIIWITSKNNFLDYSGIKEIKGAFTYSNNYKDFLNQFISGFYQALYSTNLESVSEEELEKETNDIFSSYSRILCVVDNLENIDDPKILEFIKNKIVPPNFVLITSRNGLGEINKTYKLGPLDNNSALLLFENLCKYYSIDYSKINQGKIKDLLKRTNNYPLVIKWCLSLVAQKKMELEAAFTELNKPQNDLLEFIFQKLYKDLSKNSKKILRSLALYKDIPDRNIIAYIAELKSEEELMDSVFELEQHSLINQERIDSKHGIVETINLLALAQTFIDNIIANNSNQKERIEKRIIEIEQELDSIASEENKDFRPAQKLAQSKLLKALKFASDKKVKNQLNINSLIKEAERLAPRFYIIPYYKALIELIDLKYDYGYVKQLFLEAIATNQDNGKLFYEYGKLIKKHKPSSYSEYAPVFHKAFKIDKKIGYGIDAGLAYHDQKNYSSAYSVIEELKKIDPSFPKDNQHKFWTANSIVNYLEGFFWENQDKATLLLNLIENDIESLSEIKTENYRMLRAKYCSIVGLLYALKGNNLRAKEFVDSSKEIVTIYKSTQKSLILKELICYNLCIEAYIAKDKTNSIEKVKKIEQELNCPYKKELMVKFNHLIKKIKNKSI